MSPRPSSPTRGERAGGRRGSARERARRLVSAPRRPRGATRVRPLDEEALRAFGAGTERRAWELLGAHPDADDPRAGVRFAVWAPNAARVDVIGAFNGWESGRGALAPLGSTGVWHGRMAEARAGDLYKYRVVASDGRSFDKRDPYGFDGQLPPGTASRIATPDYSWGDERWLARRAERNALDAPISIYELHLGSWRHLSEERPVTYRDVAAPLVEHVQRLGFTHVELMPLAEHPFFGSWGYQATSYYAPTARYGAPEDLMYLVDHLHRHDIGVVLDWVPSHFPTDEQGLVYFDGTHLYEHADPRQGFHPEWQSAVFNYGRDEVRSFLVSNAVFWLDAYHVDALRVDAVASMLHLDYAREEGQWVPNEHGGRENLGAIRFLRELNAAVHEEQADALTIAEESSSWPGVTRDHREGGLGFDLKWDMGWMNDTLRYMAREPIHRRYHHRELTFRSMYAGSERFLLPLSHDEVVHGKRSLLGRMPGDRWQRFANLRLLYCWAWAQPGKKLLFMGGELAQEREWSHDWQLDWWLLDDPFHRGVERLVVDLNELYREVPALHERDVTGDGLSWLDADDEERSVLSFLRLDAEQRPVLAVFNFTPVPRHNHRVGVPTAGRWEELLNSDDDAYAGSGQGNLGGLEAAPVASNGHPLSLNLVVPPLGAVLLAPRP